MFKIIIIRETAKLLLYYLNMMIFFRFTDINIADEVEADNKVNRRNNSNRSIKTEPPSIMEIKVAISRLKLNKALGIEDIFTELLKYGAEEVAPVLRTLLLEI